MEPKRDYHSEGFVVLGLCVVSVGTGEMGRMQDDTKVFCARGKHEEKSTLVDVF